MKTRQGFVSNSSSSSFVISMEKLTNEQVQQIRDHENSETFKAHVRDRIIKNKEPGAYQWDGTRDGWQVKEVEGKLWVYTAMTNFDIEPFLFEEMGLDRDIVEYMGEYPWDVDQPFMDAEDEQ